MSTVIAIFIGGGFGSLARYGIARYTAENWTGTFPVATFVANVLACLILGLAVYAFREKLMEYTWLTPMILIGFCGGFSTFSTFGLETFQLFQAGHAGMAVIYILSSVVVCTGLIWWISYLTR